ncbi:hypothetical protein [Alkalicoccus chagannorensis]|uniref:hypothetical protein n=1 Tax=Alkalicoccus chagannorensis TaxID=427072 RepID=UPI00041FF99D|nr:hypothetical protein [Alkalicoccus chagannorensis]
MEELLARLASWIQKQPDRPVIGITGHGAAGKTTFAQSLIACLGEDVNHLNTDPYIMSNVRRYTMMHYDYEGETQTHPMTACHPDAHHLDGLERDIHMMRAGLDFYTIDAWYDRIGDGSRAGGCSHPIKKTKDTEAVTSTEGCCRTQVPMSPSQQGSSSCTLKSNLIEEKRTGPDSCVGAGYSWPCGLARRTEGPGGARHAPEEEGASRYT